jgi:hypothetical protein
MNACKQLDFVHETPISRREGADEVYNCMRTVIRSSGSLIILTASLLLSHTICSAFTCNQDTELTRNARLHVYIRLAIGALIGQSSKVNT